MEKEIKEILELFVRKANQLMEEEFTIFILKHGNSLNIKGTGNSLNISEIKPTSTMENSFILTYRMFVQPQDRMNFIQPRKISSLLYGELPSLKDKRFPPKYDPSLSKEWLDKLDEVIGSLWPTLEARPYINFNIQQVNIKGDLISSDTPTRWEILETYLFGDRSHVNREKEKRLATWHTNPMMKGLIELEFRNTLMETLRAIRYLSFQAQKELENWSVVTVKKRGR